MDTYSPSIPSTAINQTPGSTRKPGSEKAGPDFSKTDFVGTDFVGTGVAETEVVHRIPWTPVSPQMYLQWGLALYAQGDTAAALWAFFESICSEPQNALSHYLCGLAFQALELRQEAKVEWEIALKLTSQDEAISSEVSSASETLWVRALVQRLLDKEAGSSPQNGPALASFFGVDAENAGPRTGRGLSAEGPETSASRQTSLEASILEDVRLYGNCYVKDSHIARQLAGAKEEQVIIWKQSFSARTGLECHLYQKTVEQTDRHDGVIFTRRETSVK